MPNRQKLKARRPGEVLHDLREERGFSIRGFARDLGIDHKRLMHLESDENARLSLLEAIQFCDALDITLEDFVSELHLTKRKRPPKAVQKASAQRAAARLRSALEALDDVLKTM